MATYEVGVWGTETLHNKQGNDVLDTIATFIERGAERAGKDVSAIARSTPIPAPTEEIKNSFSAESPCYYNTTLTYSDLLDWWESYWDCNYLDYATDSNLLVTHNGPYYGGGLGNISGPNCVANGYGIASWRDTYTYSGSTSGGSYSMKSCMHEVGHNVLKANTGDPDGDGKTQHDVGTTYDTSQGISVTVMNATPDYFDYLKNGNECNYHPPTSSFDRISFRYSNCCQGKWEKK